MMRRRQKGVSLILSLIFLVLMSLLAISAFNTSSTNLRVAGNMQARQEGAAAAQVAIEQTISSINFTISPDVVATTTVTVDIDGNGNADYQVRLSPAPRCIRVLPIRNGDLDPAADADLTCMASNVAQGAGMESEGGAGSFGNSLCSISEWQIRAESTDPRTGQKTAVVQGVATRMFGPDAAEMCK
jgi:Tfp pilus assembly protein PilX